MPYSTILLDLDFTLFDTSASEAAAFEQTLKHVGVTDSNQYIATFQRINLALWAAVERGETTPDHVRIQRFEQLITETNLDADPLVMADTFVEGLATNGDLYPGARQVIEKLNEGATLALITNGFSEVQRTRISRLDIEQYFDAVAISNEIGVAKPHTAIFDSAFEQLASPAKTSTLMVGDSLSSDIQGGINYGISTCWYNPNGKSAGQLNPITHEIARLEELLELI